jgi:hypothetical protein
MNKMGYDYPLNQKLSKLLYFLKPSQHSTSQQPHLEILSVLSHIERTCIEEASPASSIRPAPPSWTPATRNHHILVEHVQLHGIKTLVVTQVKDFWPTDLPPTTL